MPQSSPFDMDTLTRSLTLFNQQVLKCQDDAYTLAWYLFESEVEAERVTQIAIEVAFHGLSARRIDCRLSILKQVVIQWRLRKPAAYSSAFATFPQDLRLLPEPERLALVLIDILQLSYAEAAWVIGYPFNKIGRLLAHARCTVKDQ